MNSGSLCDFLNVSVRMSSNSRFFSKRQVRTLATSVDAGCPNTCSPAAIAQNLFLIGLFLPRRASKCVG
uniref:Gst13 n=1 Tax=Arundo donax TaxID=35708 RepID=A0A0A9F490_ARUDO